MLGISDANIIVKGSTRKMLPADEEPAVTISRNQTQPNLIEDGIGAIHIFPASDTLLRIEYRGYMTGHLWITPDGVAELNEHFLESTDRIPEWVVSEDRPDWFPTPVKSHPSVPCENCGTDVSVRAVVTPVRAGRESRYCRDCWKELRVNS